MIAYCSDADGIGTEACCFFLPCYPQRTRFVGQTCPQIVWLSFYIKDENYIYNLKLYIISCLRISWMVPHATDYMYMMSNIYVKDSLKLPLVSFHVKHLDQTLTKIQNTILKTIWIDDRISLWQILKKVSYNDG